MLSIYHIAAIEATGNLKLTAGPHPVTGQAVGGTQAAPAGGVHATPFAERRMIG